MDKYLVQDRSSGTVYETPQFMYIMIALTIFQEYPKETRLSYVKRYYDAISRHRINIPTPIMAECELHFDSLATVFLLMLMTPSIVSFLVTWRLVGMLPQRAGIGINAGRIRGINSQNPRRRSSAHWRCSVSQKI